MKNTFSGEIDKDGLSSTGVERWINSAGIFLSCWGFDHSVQKKTQVDLEVDQSSPWARRCPRKRSSQPGEAEATAAYIPFPVLIWFKHKILRLV
jgi:hypothetical protein